MRRRQHQMQTSVTTYLRVHFLSETSSALAMATNYASRMHSVIVLRDADILYGSVVRFGVRVSRNGRGKVVTADRVYSSAL